MHFPNPTTVSSPYVNIYCALRTSQVHCLRNTSYERGLTRLTLSFIYRKEFYDHCGGDIATGGANGITGLTGDLPLTPDQTRGLELYAASRVNRPCEPVLGDTVLASFELHGRDKWTSLAYAACSMPVFLLTFYLGVRFVKHERR